MLGEGLDAAEAAVRAGYESPSQLSREYRPLLGAPPRQGSASCVGVSGLSALSALAWTGMSIALKHATF